MTEYSKVNIACVHITCNVIYVEALPQNHQCLTQSFDGCMLNKWEETDKYNTMQNFSASKE